MKRILIIALLGLTVLACSKEAEQLPQVIAHRGYWDTEGSAQNSIASVTKAGEIGAYGSEFDVNLTADGELVVNHDYTFHGITIYEADYAAIKDSTLANGEVIPTLDKYIEAFLPFPEMKLVFELKSEGDSLYEAVSIPKCIETVKKYGVEDRTIFIAFSLSACKEIARLMPDNMVQYLTGDIAPAELFEMGIKGIDYHYSVFDEHPEWVAEAHGLGMVCNAWTVNKEEDIRRMLDLGVDQITTNAPELAQAIIAERAAAKK